MTIINPHMLPKVRSKSLRDACRKYPCSLRIASFGGMRCAHQSTVVGCHLPSFGKGVSTKVSDLFIAAGCQVCHDLLDGRDPRGFVIAETYPAAFAERIMLAHHETLMRWWVDEILIIKDAETVQ